ncbi:hypothetical protein [Fervidicoccus fontis]|uniref:HD domain-containing protein n=1 Tax=Fervidicoccus fontis (strain DSM 19380 / JCM 18336 / VKM B-2539 / Kam940) TaxID=1163730 RepID=H9ZZ96_FERFK|nr:hypothetical protein [Fervidicoccus fontis]AFH42053.1 hypothetical protein FFONT_0059 [Fervidicoccus fontis Kam940]
MSFWARKGQMLDEHIKKMIDFYEKCYKRRKYTARLSKRLGIPERELDMAMVSTIIFHDMGKIFYHNPETKEPPESFAGHEILSSLVMHIASKKLELKKNMKPDDFSFYAVPISMHLAVRAHHLAMGDRLSTLAIINRFYGRFLNSTYRSKIPFILRDFLAKVVNGMGLEEWLEMREKVEDEELKGLIETYKEFTERYLAWNIFEMHEPKAAKVSMMAQHILKVLIMSDNYSASQVESDMGEERNIKKKFFVDFDLSCIEER